MTAADFREDDTLIYRLNNHIASLTDATGEFEIWELHQIERVEALFFAWQEVIRHRLGDDAGDTFSEQDLDKAYQTIQSHVPISPLRPAAGFHWTQVDRLDADQPGIVRHNWDGTTENWAEIPYIHRPKLDQPGDDDTRPVA